MANDKNFKIKNGLNVSDNSKVYVGDGLDLQIYHDGTRSYISDVGAGDLRISTNTGITIWDDNNVREIATLNGSGITLWHNGTEVLSTSGIGINTANIYTTGAITFEGSTDDGFETVMAVDDPTADRTFTIPDQTGTAMLWQQAWPDDPATNNIPIGTGALNSNTGNTNISIGVNSLYSQTTGYFNVAVGANAGYSMTTGNQNVLIGHQSGQDITTGYQNTAVGQNALNSITTGYYNTVIGADAGDAITTGYQNTIVGQLAGTAITTGYRNTLFGRYSGAAITTGQRNTLIGVDAGYQITSGLYNTSVGDFSAGYLTIGTNNITIGYQAGRGLSTGDNNIAMGYRAAIRSDADNSIAIGYRANYAQGIGDHLISIGSYSHYQANPGTAGNVMIGYYAGYYANQYNTAVGYQAMGQTTNSSYTDQNVAVGYNALSYGAGDRNVAVGYNAKALWQYLDDAVIIGSSSYGASNSVSIGSGATGNTNSGIYSVSIGVKANYNMTGNNNVSIGYYAGSNEGVSSSSQTYTQCVFIGSRAGRYATTASNVVAIGGYAGSALSSGTNNTHVGRLAGFAATSGSDITTLGYEAGRGITLGSENTFIGSRAGYDALTIIGSNLTAIGRLAMPSSGSASNEFTLGNSSVTTLRCNTTSISSLSDERDKTDIQDIPYGLSFINDLRPVTFQWNRRDGTMGQVRQAGFIAQDLSDVEINHSSTQDTHLVSWSNPDRLEAAPLNTYPILVKAVQELSAKCDALEARLAALEGV